jgi:phenylalanyl-tRNA synthetase alpha chain
MSELSNIQSNFQKELSKASNKEQLNQLHIKYLSKKGIIASQMQLLAKLPANERKDFGSKINNLKLLINTQLNNSISKLQQAAINEQLANEQIDVTLPSRKKQLGKTHPISHTIEEIITIFAKMGFSVAEGPEIEDEFHNFNALNIPENHPARQMHDTFYIANTEQKKMLRTHTSSVQIRSMLKGKAPFKIISPGKTFRKESDATHTPMFHQIEALFIDESTNMGHLKYCIQKFLNEFFGSNNKLRFRSSFFPFTEPSAEVDIAYTKTKGKISIGSGDDYMEILGCGMVHPNVLTNVNIDPKKYQGFALGMGVERLAMLKYGMADLRQFFENDPNWLNHYSFKSHFSAALANL